MQVLTCLPGQMTQGEGVFRITPALYQQLPSNLVAEVIASASE